MLKDGINKIEIESYDELINITLIFLLLKL